MSFFPQGPNAEPKAPGVYNNPNGLGAKILDVDEELPNSVYMLKTLKQGAGMVITEGPNDITLTSSGIGAAEVNDLLDGYHVATNMSVGQKLVAPSGTGNTVISGTVPSLTSGVDNTLVGNNAGSILTSQTGNTLVGADAGKNGNGQNNTVLGADAYTNIAASGNSNTIVGGSGTGSSLTSGFNNTLVGKGVDGSAAVAGAIALGISSTGVPAVATKNNALFLPPNYVDNTEALVKPMVYDPITGECGSFPLGLAGQVLATNATTNGVEWVNDAGGVADIDGLIDGYHQGDNLALGTKPTSFSGNNNVHVTGTALPAIVGGSFNVGVGDQSLSNASLSGSNNVQIGFGAGNNITTGSGNINVGCTNSVTSGSNNITIGQSAVVNPSGSNQIALGQGASCTQNNSIAINPATIPPSAPDDFLAFDSLTGEIGPANLLGPNQLLGMDAPGTGLEGKAVVGSVGLTVNNTAGQIELVNDTNPVNDGDIVIGNGLGVGSQIHAFTAVTGQLIHEKGGLEADVSGYDGFPQIKAGATSNLKTNFTATIAPTNNDDADDGYSVGSIWIDTTAGNIYQCVDPTLLTAIWKQLDAAAGAVAIANLTDANTAASSIALGYKPTALLANSVFITKSGPATTPATNVIIQPTMSVSALGADNIVIGANAAQSLSSATQNVVIGTGAGAGVNTGSSHLIAGYNANVTNGTSGCVALGNGATANGNNAIAIGNGASTSIANAMALPSTLTHTDDSVTTLLPTAFNTTNGQLAPLDVGTAGQVLAVNGTATGVEWVTGGGGGSGIISWGMVRNSNTITLTGTYTAISNWNGTSTVSSDAQFTSTTAGITYIGVSPVYVKMLCTGLGMIPNDTSTNGLQFTINGSIVGQVNNIYTSAALGGLLWYPISHSYIAQVSNGDIISFAGQTTGGTAAQLRELVLTVEKLEAPAGPQGPAGPSGSAGPVTDNVPIPNFNLSTNAPWNNGLFIEVPNFSAPSGFAISVKAISYDPNNKGSAGVLWYKPKNLDTSQPITIKLLISSTATNAGAATATMQLWYQSSPYFTTGVSYNSTGITRITNNIIPPSLNNSPLEITFVVPAIDLGPAEFPFPFAIARESDNGSDTFTGGVMVSACQIEYTSL